MSSREASRSSTSTQEYCVHYKTFGDASHGFIWASGKHKHCGNKYGFVIVDDCSRFTWVFFLQDKSEVQETFKKFARRAQNEFEVKIKRIRSDNGSEFKNTSIEEFLDEEGIKHEFSAPYTPQQNGVVER